MLDCKPKRQVDLIYSEIGDDDIQELVGQESGHAPSSNIELQTHDSEKDSSELRIKKIDSIKAGGTSSNEMGVTPKPRNSLEKKVPSTKEHGSSFKSNRNSMEGKEEQPIFLRPQLTSPLPVEKNVSGEDGLMSGAQNSMM